VTYARKVDHTKESHQLDIPTGAKVPRKFDGFPTRAGFRRERRLMGFLVKKLKWEGVERGGVAAN